MKMLYIPNWEDNYITVVDVTGKLTKDGFVQTSNGMIHAHSLLPMEAEPKVTSILKERAQLKKAFDDSVSLVYQLNNSYHGKKGF